MATHQPRNPVPGDPVSATHPQHGRTRWFGSIRLKEVGKAPYRLVIGLIVLWASLYVPRSLAAHYALKTNAFDLSVFDYALWSSLHGPHVGFVPFFGYSLFAQHFMPTLLALLPLYGLWQSPVLLILVQFAAQAGTGLLLATWSLRRGVATVATCALLFGFLFSRPAHSAVSGVFYIECLEPLLVVALCLVADTPRRWAYWLLLFLALGCKEDVGLYLGLFGLVLASTGRQKRLGWMTAAVSFTWTAFAVLAVVPFVRHVEGLPTAYPFLSFQLGGRETASHGLQALEALLSVSTLTKTLTVTGSTALLCWAAPRLLLPALPALILGASGAAVAVQGGLSGHYLWPLLPWLWLSAVDGWRRLSGRFPRFGTVLAAALVLVTIANSPLWTSLRREVWPDLRRPSLARQSLLRLPAAQSLAVQPNLIPHLPHQTTLTAVGSDYRPARDDPEVVVLTFLGNLWPLDEAGVGREAKRWTEDERYRECVGIEVLVFSRVGCRASPSVAPRGSAASSPVRWDAGPRRRAPMEGRAK